MPNNLSRYLTYLAVILLSASMLSACSKSSQNNRHYYVFDTFTRDDSAPTGDRPVRLLPIEMPAYLRQRSLVMHDGTSRIVVSQSHFWADNPKDAIQRELMRQLNTLSSTHVYRSSCSACPSLRVRIDHFYPTEDGEVLLIGQFEKDDDTSTSHAFSLTKDLHIGGYAEAVEAMRDLISTLARQIDTAQ